MKVGRQVERSQSPNGKHLLRIFRRDSSFYFVEISELTEKDETFWIPTKESTFYESLDAARSEAIATVAWLKEVI